MTSSLDTNVSVSPEVLLQEIDGEAVLLDLKSECYFGLNLVGTRIWRLLERGGDLRAVHAALLDEFEVESDRLKHDIEDLVSQLADAGLVTVTTARAGQG
jgi:coenzyme PQQ synthesis protein D (PqqD)